MKLTQTKVALGALLALGALATAPAHAGATLDKIKKNGQVVCGVNTGLAGFSQADSNGAWSGLDVDICRAIAAAVLGDGNKVNGLLYKDRNTDEIKRIDLEGIFVQIGLLPNTEWLRGAVELSPRGEVVIDDRGATSVPGVFAAGDCTTVPFKQIVIAVGAGATASLSAFDHLIRTSAPAAELVTA